MGVVVLARPHLREGVKGFRLVIIVFAVKALALRVVEGCKAVYGVGAPLPVH
jgi:hypothetical protein